MGLTILHWYKVYRKLMLKRGLTTIVDHHILFYDFVSFFPLKMLKMLFPYGCGLVERGTFLTLYKTHRNMTIQLHQI